MYINQLIQRILHSRTYKWFDYIIHNISLPGNKGVPLYDIITHLLRGIGQGDLWRASKGLAFSFLSALPPLLIFMFTLIAFLPVDGLQDELLWQLHDLIPEKFFNPVANTINDVMGHKHTSLLSIGFVSSIILAANAMHGMMMYFSDRGRDRRKFVRRYVLCIALVFMLYMMVVLVLACFIGYRQIITYLFQHNILVPGSFTHIIIGIGRWIILVAAGLLTITSIYYLIPMKKERVGFFSSGAVFAMIMFILLSWGFRVYLVHFDQYNLLYGSIGTLLVVMLWLFLNCLVLMLGYELNVAISTGNIGDKASKKHDIKAWNRQGNNDIQPKK